MRKLSVRSDFEHVQLYRTEIEGFKTYDIPSMIVLSYMLACSAQALSSI